MSEAADFNEERVFPITAVEYYHLIDTYGPVLAVWNAEDLNTPSAARPIEIPRLNPHFRADDCGPFIRVSPKDLYDTKRTEGDAIEAARQVTEYAIREKGWLRLELTGHDKMVSAGVVAILTSDQKATPIACPITEKEERNAALIRLARSEGVKPTLGS